MTVAEKILRAKDDYDAVYESGKVAEYDAFWDAYQENGNSKQYHYAFAGYGWNDATFYPKYDIVMQSSCLGAFQYSKITDIVERLKECGVELDTSNCSNFQAMFAYATTKSLPTINTLKATSLTSIFTDCRSLERIEKLVVKKASTYGTCFKGCQVLKDIVFEGEIGNDISFSDSPLSKASIESIVEHLSDTATGKTLTLSQTAVESAFDSEEIVLHPYDLDHDQLAMQGYTVTDNGDGSVTVNGGNSEISTGYFRFFYDILPAGVYEVSFSQTGEGYNFAMPCSIYDGDGGMVDAFPVDSGSTHRITVGENGRLALDADLMGFYTNKKMTPTLKRLPWETLKATKPNWTITEV